MPCRKDDHTRVTTNEKNRAAMQRRLAQAAEVDRKERTKHPKFDQYWEEHNALLWWFAHRAVRFFHHRYGATTVKGERLWYGGHEASEFIGQLVIRMNRVLYSFDESLGFKFSTYFQMNLYSELFRRVTRFDSIARDMATNKATLTATEDVHQMDLELADFDHSKRFYRIPDTDWDFVYQIIDSFDDAQDLWRFITANMKTKQKYVLYGTYKKGLNSEALGERLMLSRERIRQLLESAKQKVRDQLKKLENFVRLFRLEEGEVEATDQEAMDDVLDGGKRKGFSEPKRKEGTVSDDVWFEVTSFFDT